MVSYSPSTILAWNIAAIEAKSGNAIELEPAHLLLGICKLCDLDGESLPIEINQGETDLVQEIQADIATLKQLFEQGKFNPTNFRRRLRVLIAKPDTGRATDETIHRSTESRCVFLRAEEIAAQIMENNLLRPLHLLQALLEIPNPSWSLLLSYMGIPNPLTLMFGSTVDLQVAPQPTHRTPFLDRFGHDLTQLARDGKLDPVIGRHEEIRSLARTLIQKRKRNVILVGEAGVGKTCIVEGLALELISSRAPLVLQQKRVVGLSMSALVAGTKYRGEFEGRMQALLAEATVGEDIILFIDEIHTVLGAGGDGASNAANILKPALARGDLQCIGATTVNEYRETIEKDTALARRFQLVRVKEPSRSETVTILQGLRPKFEEHHEISITDAAIEAAVELSVRYLPFLRLPDKAIDLIDEAMASVRLASMSEDSDRPAVASINAASVAAVVAQRIGISIEQLTESAAQHLLGLAESMRQRLNSAAEAGEIMAENDNFHPTPANEAEAIEIDEHDPDLE